MRVQQDGQGAADGRGQPTTKTRHRLPGAAGAGAVDSHTHAPLRVACCLPRRGMFLCFCENKETALM